MKFYTALFAAGAVASSIKRQGGGVDALVSDIQAITTATGTLGDSISGFSSISDAAGIITNVGAVNDAINKGVSDAGSTPTLSIADASTLIDPVQSLQAAVKSAVDASISKQDAFNSNGLCSEVQNQLGSLQSGGQSLADALTAIVPDSLKETAQQLSAPILADLQRAADAYSSCPSSSGTPSGSTGPTSTPSGSASGSASGSGSSSGPTPTGYSPSSASPSGSAAPTKSASGSIPPSSYGGGSTPTAAPTPSGSSAPPVYTGAAAAFVPAFGGIAAAGLAILAL